MLTRGIYCACCGGPVRRDVLDFAIPCRDEDTKSLNWTYDGSKINIDDTEWISKFRLLGPKNSVPIGEPSSGSSSPSTPSPQSPVTPDETQLAPVLSNLQQQYHQALPEVSEVSISLEAEWVDWTEVRFPTSENPEKLYTVYAASDIYSKRDFLVPVHDACLELVKSVARNVERRAVLTATRSAPSTVTDNDALARFYNSLRRRRQQNVREHMVFPAYASAGGVEWSHGYYGARGFWGQGWICKRGSEYIVANPWSVPEISDYIISRLDELDAAEDKTKQMSVTTTTAAATFAGECSQLESLPAPAMDCLLSQLSISDAVRLRDCSERTREESVRLTPRFWRDRLLSGEAVEWVWDLSKEEAEKAGVGRDWEGVVKEMRQMTVKPVWIADAEGRPEALGMRNRRRVVKIVTEILSS